MNSIFIIFGIFSDIILKYFQLKQRDMLIDSYQKDIDKMKQVTRTLVVETSEVQSLNTETVAITASGDYFNSYSHFGIHHEMLNVSVKLKLFKSKKM